MSITGVASNVIGSAIGMIGQRKREKRAMRNQEHLMDVQHKNQRELNQQGHDMQKEMWDYTNYGNQVKHMQDAGLNVGMMYGLGGGGGTTAGSQSGGAAAGGQAPAPQQMPMDIANLTQAANLELMRSQSNKNNAEADSIRGGEGTQGATQIAEGTYRIEKLKAETTNVELQQALTKALTMTETQRSGLVLQEAIKTAEEVVKLSRENHIGEETIEAVINEIKANSAGAEIVNELNRSRIKLTETQDRQLEEAIAQKWAEIDLHDTEVNIKIAQTIINGITGIGGLIQAGRLAEAMRKGKQATEKTWGEGFKGGVEEMKKEGWSKPRDAWGKDKTMMKKPK